MNAVTLLTDENFNAEVLAADKPVLVNFTATWDPASQQMAENLRQLAEDRGDIKVTKIDVGGTGTVQDGDQLRIVGNENIQSAEIYNIQAFPTFILFKGGEVAGFGIGVQDKEELAQWADSILNSTEYDTIPVDDFHDYAEQHYKQAREALLKQQQAEQQEQAQQQQAQDEKSLHTARRVGLVWSFARAAGALTLATILPNWTGAILGTAMMAPAMLQTYETFKYKDRAPQGMYIRNGLLRTVFNLAALDAGATLASAMAYSITPSFKGAACAAAAAVGLGVALPALYGLGSDIVGLFGKLFSTDLSKYPVERPQKAATQTPDKEEKGQTPPPPAPTN